MDWKKNAQGYFIRNARPAFFSFSSAQGLVWVLSFSSRENATPHEKDVRLPAFSANTLTAESSQMNFNLALARPERDALKEKERPRAASPQRAPLARRASRLTYFIFCDMFFSKY